MRRRWLVVLAAMLLLLAAPGGPGLARADGPSAAEQRELRIERSLACPQCTGVAVDVCDQDICTDMRNVIHAKVAAGESDRAIQQYFVERFGPRVLLAPPKNATNLVAWLLPSAAVLAGALAIYGYINAVRNQPRNRLRGSSPRADPSGYRARVERDVELFE